MLALDPPGDERLTVGEVFDRALCGPRATATAAARPGPGDAGRAAGRHRGPRGRPGGQERGRVRPAQAVHRGGRSAGPHPRADGAAAPAAAGDTPRWCARPVDAIALEPLAPACVEYPWPPERLLVRFERPVAAALADAHAGGSPAASWSPTTSSCGPSIARPPPGSPPTGAAGRVRRRDRAAARRRCDADRGPDRARACCSAMLSP